VPRTAASAAPGPPAGTPRNAAPSRRTAAAPCGPGSATRAAWIAGAPARKSIEENSRASAAHNERAIAAVQEGAADYLFKDPLKRRVSTVQRAPRESPERRRRRTAANALRESKARLAITTDRPEHRNLVDHFRRAQRLASVGRLASGIAPNLTTVLSPRLMGVPMLPEHITAPGDLQLRAMFEKNAERGAGLVRQILRFTQGGGGEPRQVHVTHLLRDLSMVTGEPLPENIRFDTCIAPNLWSITASPTQIHPVLLNLCMNARDALLRGGTLARRAQNLVVEDRAVRASPGDRPGTLAPPSPTRSPRNRSTSSPSCAPSAAASTPLRPNPPPEPSALTLRPNPPPEPSALTLRPNPPPEPSAPPENPAVLFVQK
jgi:signal transduction histidine kinase